MPDQNNRFPTFWWLAGLWLGVNLLQAAFTELDPDEAYYWMYAQELAWGYFDHPPAIALLIWLGERLFSGELAVRLGVVLLQTASFWFLWDLAGRPRDGAGGLLLIALLAAMPMLQVYGFIATPDGPLLFFTIFFFWVYRRYLQRDSWLNAALLAGAMAALLYSKYHGLLVIGFTALSNVNLWRRPSFYVAGVGGVLLFLPHLYWQHLNDFPSFRYHLVGRDDPYELKHTATYLVNQLLIFNPLLAPLWWLALRRSFRKEDPESRAWYFNLFGFWLFFFLMTFKGHAEPQWTAVLSVPLVLLTYRYARKDGKTARWVRRIGAASVLLFLLGRLTLVVPQLAFRFNKEFHRQAWTQELADRAAGRPLVFQDSYRDASKYAFYTGEPAYTFTDKDYRRNQFDIWNLERRLHNQKVLIAGHKGKGWPCAGCERVDLSGNKSYQLKWAESLQIVQKVEMRVDSFPATLNKEEPALLSGRLINPYDHAVDRTQGNMPITLVALWYGAGEDAAAMSPARLLAPPGEIPAKDTLALQVQLTPPDTLALGRYSLILGWRTGDLPPAQNSNPIVVRLR